MPEIDTPQFNEMKCLQQLAEGDHSAFACLHDRYSKKSYAYALMMTRSEYLGILYKGVSLLPPRQKEVYQLSRDHGWKQETIATRLNLSPRTVKVHMVQALHFVRDYVSASLGK